MARKRMTYREKLALRDQEDEKIWERFLPALRALQTLENAYELMARSPGPDRPGRRFYSNLGFFLSSGMVPDGSCAAEREAYLELMKKLDAQGVLKPGALASFEEHIKEANERRYLR